MSLKLKPQRFLLDENVRAELRSFLKKNNCSVKSSPKSISDLSLIKLSVEEKRILVTNDEDFLNLEESAIFALIILKIPQNQPEVLIDIFNKLLKAVKNWKGKQIILKPDGWSIK